MAIAMAIAAALAVLAHQALSGTRQAEKINAVTQQVDDHDRVWQYLASDLLYAEPRTWRDRDGNVQSAMLGVLGDRVSQSDIVSSEDYVLQFVRANRDNFKRTRSRLMMVGYRIVQAAGSETQSLWRDSWSPVDGFGEPSIQQRLLLSDITHGISLFTRYRAV